jgi:hypothetical protein
MVTAALEQLYINIPGTATVSDYKILGQRLYNAKEKYLTMDDMFTIVAFSSFASIIPLATI